MAFLHLQKRRGNDEEHREHEGRENQIMKKKDHPRFASTIAHAPFAIQSDPPGIHPSLHYRSHSNPFKKILSYSLRTLRVLRGNLNPDLL